MPYLLDLVYLLLVLAYSPVLIFHAFRSGKYRDGWAEKFLGRHLDASATALAFGSMR